jgi:hypothetical protein
MLTTLLEQDAVPLATLHERYGSLLKLVRKLIGVVPNCDPYLEIWPPAFRTYNVMVPNFLDLPFLLWGRGPRVTMGLAMYVASRTAGCPYCSAHTCSFALRRGASAEEVAASLTVGAALTPAQQAAVRVARALSAVPAEAPEDLTAHFSPADAERIVLAIAMMGWLNKTMDALGVPLEVSTVAEVNAIIAPSGWTPGQHMHELPADGAPARADTLGTKLGVVPLIPSAIALDRRWMKGVPAKWPKVGDFLRAATGHDFPLLSRLRSARAVRAIATMIRDNFDAEASVLGRDAKLATGLVYADVVGSPALADALRATGAKAPVDSPLVRLARAIAPSPARVDEAALADARTLPPAGIVELVSFVSVLQMLHRLSIYDAAHGGPRA